MDNSPGSSGELARVTARFAERALGHPRLSFEAWFHAVERVAAHASGPALDALIERAFEFDDPAAELVEQCERFERGASLSQ